VLLDVRSLTTAYRGLIAVSDVSINVGEGEIVAVAGANGAGKSTLLKSISGMERPRDGSITFAGEPIQALPAHLITARGLAYVPENRRLFPRLSVADNLRLGSYLHRKAPDRNAPMERVFALFPQLKERLPQRAETLSGGEQQMLAIGRALMARPRILLLDEPSMGLAPLLVEEIFEIIKSINEQGTTILLVEQNARMALEIADQGYVLQSGVVQLTDKAGALMHNDMVRKLYLGEN
jgi:branched-chain amino acid transport system ATP-binding protein